MKLMLDLNKCKYSYSSFKGEKIETIELCDNVLDLINDFKVKAGNNLLSLSIDVPLFINNQPAGCVNFRDGGITLGDYYLGEYELKTQGLSVTSFGFDTLFCVLDTIEAKKYEYE